MSMNLVTGKFFYQDSKYKQLLDLRQASTLIYFVEKTKLSSFIIISGDHK